MVRLFVVGIRREEPPEQPLGVDGPPLRACRPAYGEQPPDRAEPGRPGLLAQGLRPLRVGLVLEGEPTLSPASPVRVVMNELPVTVTPDTPLPEAAREMLDRKIGALPVLEDDRPAGILTVADALEALLRWVECGARTPAP